MNYQFSHNEDTILGKFERDFHTRYLQLTHGITNLEKNEAYLQLVDSARVLAAVWQICRNIAATSEDHNELRRQIGQRLTASKIKVMRAAPEDLRCWQIESGGLELAFRKITEV